MSDESTPLPPLRLKPRLRREVTPAPAEPAPVESTPHPEPPPVEPAAVEPPPEVQPEPVAEYAAEPASEPAPEAISEAPPAIDFSPPEPPAPVEYTPVEQEAVVVPEPPSMPEPQAELPAEEPPTISRPTLPPYIGDALDVNRLKLKPRPPTGDAPTSLPPPVRPAVQGTAPSMGLPPVSTAPVRSSLPTTPPMPFESTGLPPLAPSAGKPPPFIRTKAVGSTTGSREAPEQTRAFRVGLGVAIGLVVVALGGIIFLGVRFVSAKNDKKASLAAAAAKPTPPSPAPATTPATETAPHKSVLATDHPQSLAGKAIAKAEATIAEREQSGQVAGVDQVLNTETAKPAVKTPTPKPAATAVPTEATPAPSAAKPSVAAADTEDAPEPTPPKRKLKPTAALRAFVVNARISGVFQGDPGRVLLNGRMYRIGEVVDADSGIRLTRLDSEHKVLVFEDITGAEMERRY